MSNVIDEVAQEMTFLRSKVVIELNGKEFAFARRICSGSRLRVYGSRKLFWWLNPFCSNREFYVKADIFLTSLTTEDTRTAERLSSAISHSNAGQKSLCNVIVSGCTFHDVSIEMMDIQHQRDFSSFEIRFSKKIK